MIRSISNPPAGQWANATKNRARAYGPHGQEVSVQTPSGWHTVYLTNDFIRELAASL